MANMKQNLIMLDKLMAHEDPFECEPRVMTKDDATKDVEEALSEKVGLSFKPISFEDGSREPAG